MWVLSLALLALSWLPSGLLSKKVKEAEWNALKVTYGQNGEGYHDLPWSVEEATQGNWQKIDYEKKLNVDVFSQPQDPRLLLLFNRRGTIAGIRLAILKDDAQRKGKGVNTTFHFDYDKNPWYKKTNYFGKELWHTSVIFTYIYDLIWFGGRHKRNKDKDELTDVIYYNHYGKWSFIRKDECRVSPKWDAELVEGGCFPGIGKHYFYHMNITDCEHRLPFFVTYDKGRVSGFGLAGYGTSPGSSVSRNYYDQGHIPLKTIMGDVPKCVEENVEKYGLIMMHVFVKKNASKITCPDKDWKLTHCDLPGTKHLLPWLDPFSL